ncbi:peptide ABC transporter substrate-binding protein [Alicyclobacillus vulcanalis]|uniref:Peptide/nickel transport system substrate-binding protein n=1 Tax=Alicyclobacillus vulcanalis TaxID=252246 RepID=A0A1N7MCD5_9BACL|nr:peptide ABC transporter substrate-binding protein [Alicyclobacillus vulcanalis]SIS83718.1 peptide/nickel transport system substrate-binding protein [Alicyclobacillus vulcanalis]
MKHKRRKYAWGVATLSVLTAAGLAAGCSTTTSPATSHAPSTKGVQAAADVTPAQKGGTLIVALPAGASITWYIPIVNASNNSLYNARLISCLYPGLIYINDQYKIDWQDSFASKITYNSAGTVYTVYLKKDWKWSDGQPVTADDVLFDYDVFAATSANNAPKPWPNTAAGSGGVPDNIRSVKKLDNYTIQITLKKPVNQQWFIYNGIGLLAPIPKHAWDKYPNNMTQEITYLGKEAQDASFVNVVDGPFKLQSAKQNQAWTLVPNPTFGGHKSTLDKLVFQYEASTAAEFAALRSGTIGIGYLDWSMWDSRQQLIQQGYTVQPAYSFAYDFIELNMLKGSPLYSAFSDLRVRQALEMAIDQDSINKDIFHGYAPPLYGPIPSTPKTQFFDPKLSKPLYPFNLQKAAALLDQAGWKLQNGVRTKDGVQLSFDMLVPSGEQTALLEAELVQQDWKSIGVVANLKQMPLSEEFSVMGSGDPKKWEAASGTGIIYGGSYPSGELLFKPGGLDNFGFDDPALDKLIDKTTNPEPSLQATLKDFYAYEELTAKDLPVLWVNVPAGIRVVAKNVHNVNDETMNPVVGVPLYNYIWMSH